jgi:drug/metabolite transporter (DMT)-like permease
MSLRKLLAYAAIYFLWGASFLAIRQVVAVTPPFFAAAFRFLCAGLILYSYSVWRGMPQPNQRQWISTAVLGLVMFAGDYGCLFYAEKVVPSGLAAVIAATIPVWVLLAEWLVARTQRPTGKSLTGITLGILGVVLLTIPAGLRSAGFGASAFVLLLGTFCWAGGTVASRHMELPRQITMSAGLQMSWGGLFLLLLSAMTGELRRLPTLAHQWNWHIAFAMAYLILFASIMAFSAYVWLIARDPATRVASYAYVNPVIALMLGSLLAQERPTAIQYAGAALVLGGVASTIAGKRPATPAATAKRVA